MRRSISPPQIIVRRMGYRYLPVYEWIPDIAPFELSWKGVIKEVLEEDFGVAVGRFQSPRASQSIIQPHEWRYLNLVEHYSYDNFIGKSSVDNTVYYDLRFFSRQESNLIAAPLRAARRQHHGRGRRARDDRHRQSC